MADQRIARAFDDSVIYAMQGTCYRCRAPWNVAKGHATPYTTPDLTQHGLFPLCELCWADLSPEERLPYYEALLNRWEWDSPVDADTRARIRAAVLEGK